MTPGTMISPATMLILLGLEGLSIAGALPTAPLTNRPLMRMRRSARFFRQE